MAFTKWSVFLLKALPIHIRPLLLNIWVMLSDPTKYDSVFPFPLFRPLPSKVQLAFEFFKKDIGSICSLQWINAVTGDETSLCQESMTTPTRSTSFTLFEWHYGFFYTHQESDQWPLFETGHTVFCPYPKRIQYKGAWATTTTTRSRLFVCFYALVVRLSQVVKLPDLTFHVRHDHKKTSFFSFSELRLSPLVFSSRKIRQNLTKLNELELKLWSFVTYLPFNSLVLTWNETTSPKQNVGRTY